VTDNAETAKPINAQVPSFIGQAKKVLYNPQTDKFDGYAQYARPVVKPYGNIINYQSEVSTREFSLKQKKSLGMIKKPALSAERNYSGSVGAGKGLLLYESLKDSSR
jgi:hypothetical protein